MTAKEYLKRLKSIRLMIDNKKEQIEKINTSIMSPAVAELKRDKVQTSIELHKQENKIAEKETLENDIRRLITEKTEICHLIDNMPTAVYSRLLYLRYAEERDLKDIATIIHYTHGYVRDLHGKALDEFTNIYRDVIM